MADPHRLMSRLPVSLVARDPAAALRRAQRLLGSSTDPRIRSLALRISGLAVYELGSFTEARKRLTEAVRVAVQANLAEEALLARASWTGALSRYPGPSPRIPVATASTSSALWLLAQGVAAYHSGRFDDALAAFTAAEPALRTASDPRLLPGLLCSRGLALIRAGLLTEAEETLLHGLALAEQYSLPRLSAMITQNLGCLAARQGDTGLAMARFAQAAPLLQTPTRYPALVLERAHALADAGMVREAWQLNLSLGKIRGCGADRALAELLSLKIAVASRAHVKVAATVDLLERLFGAESAWLRAAEQITETRGGSLPAPRAVPPPPATPHLEVAAHATPLRTAQALHHATAALQSGAAKAALRRLEQARTIDLGPHTCRNQRWAALLDRYRATFAEAWRGVSTARYKLHELEVEMAVDQWHPCCRPRDASSGQGWEDPWEALSTGLGSRALVHYSDLDQAPAALTVVDGTVRLHELAAGSTIKDAVTHFEHLAAQHVFSPGPTTARLLARRAEEVQRLLFEPIAAAIGDREMVIAPGAYTQVLPWGLLPALRGRPISVVPSGQVWLRCRQRALHSRQPPRALLVAGLGPEDAEAEVRAIARLYPRSRILVGAKARSRTVLRGLARADLAHFSAHGFARNGAPMCAGLVLADGPLLAYDVERVQHLPALVVLSSCTTGRPMPAVPSGFPLGIAASLLARGSATVVASVLRVPDVQAAAAMVRAHQALRSGVPPATVVAEHLAHLGFVCFGAG